MQSSHWWQHAVMYELYVDKFAGTFLGLTERLDYLERLGVNCLNILPHYPSPMVDDGYDVSDYRNVRAELGTLADFKHFTDAAHMRGMHVLVDLVLNHVSAQHPWFVSARASNESPYRNYFLWSDTGEEYEGALNPFSHLKPHNWIKNESTNDYHFATFYPEQPDLNWHEPRVFEEMCAVMDFWIDAGVDAFRFDAAQHLIKIEGTNSYSLPETHELLKRIRAKIDRHHKDIAILSEVYGSLTQTIEHFGTGDECHMLYNFPLAPHVVLAALEGTTDQTNLPVPTQTLPDDCAWVNFIRTHDALPLVFLTPEQQEKLVAYADPMRECLFRGERGLSMRLASIFAREPEKARDAFDLLFSAPGVPVIYYGEEIGMHNDTSIGTTADTRRYVRGQFDWVEAERQMQDPASLFSFVADLTHTRGKGT